MKTLLLILSLFLIPSAAFGVDKVIKAPSGKIIIGTIGDTVSANITSDTSISSPGEVDINGASITIGTGKWLVQYSCPVIASGSTSGGAIVGFIRITNSSNAAVAKSATSTGWYGSNFAAQIEQLYNYVFITVSSGTQTYKLRGDMNTDGSVGSWNFIVKGNGNCTSALSDPDCSCNFTATKLKE